jgi:hypothetical protein
MVAVKSRARRTKASCKRSQNWMSSYTRKGGVKVTGHCHTPRKASRKPRKQSRKDREDERLAAKIRGLQGKVRKASRKHSKRSCGSNKKMKRVRVASHKRGSRKVKGHFRCIKRSA